MDLNTIFKELKEQARILGSYEKISINELADKYCEATDAGDSAARETYFSALVLRFWYCINKMYTENKSLNLEYTDYFDGLIDAINLACAPENRAWQKNEKLNAQQVINQTLATRFIAQKYYESNLKKNAGQRNVVSIDEQFTDDSDSNSLLDILKDENAETYQDNSNIYYLIQNYIDRNKLVEAIILDNIAFKDTFKHEKETKKTVDTEGNAYKYTEYSTTFWPFKFVKEMSALDDSYENYFKSTYNVPDNAFKAAFKAVRKANNQKKYKYLYATLDALKAEFEASEVI